MNCLSIIPRASICYLKEGSYVNQRFIYLRLQRNDHHGCEEILEMFDVVEPPRFHLLEERFRLLDSRIYKPRMRCFRQMKIDR